MCAAIQPTHTAVRFRPDAEVKQRQSQLLPRRRQFEDVPPIHEYIEQSGARGAGSQNLQRISKQRIVLGFRHLAGSFNEITVPVSAFPESEMRVLDVVRKITDACLSLTAAEAIDKRLIAGIAAGNAVDTDLKYVAGFGDSTVLALRNLFEVLHH